MSTARLRSALPQLAQSRWARRLAWIALALIGARALLALATPLAFALAARTAGVELDYSGSRLSLLRGEFELRDARVSARSEASAAPLAHLGRLRVDLDLGALVRGEFRIAQAEVDGLELWLDVAADGSCAWSSVGAEERTSSTTPATNAPLSLALPLDFSAQLLRARLHLRDSSVTPPIEVTLQADGRAEARAGAGNAVLWIAARDALRQARVELDFTLSERSVELDFFGSFEGLDLRAVQGRLAAAGLEAREGALSGSTRARASVQLLDAAGPTFSGRVAVRDLLLRCDSIDVLRLAACELSARELTSSAVAFSALRVINPTLRLDQLDDGRVAFAGLSASTAPAPASTASASAPAGSRTLALERFSIVGARAELHELHAAGAEPLELTDVALDVSNLRWPVRRGQPPVRWECRASAPGVFGAFVLSGAARPASDALTLEARAELVDATFARLAPRLAQFGIEPQQHAAELRAQLAAQLDWSAGLRLTGALENVSWSDGRAGLAFERLSIDGARLVETRAEVDRIALSGVRAQVTRDADGAWRALGFVLRSPTVAENGAASSDAMAPSSPASAAPTGISALQLESLNADLTALEFVDELPAKPVRLELRNTGLELTQLDLGDVAAPRRGSLRAWLASDQLASELRVEGQLALARERLELTGAIEARDADLRALAPYLASAGVEPTLERGAARAQFELKAQRTGAQWSVDTNLRDVELLEGERRLLALDRAVLAGLALRPTNAGLEFRSLLIERPYALIERDAQGRLAGCGVRLGALDSATAPQAAPFGEYKLPTAWFPLAVRGERIRVRDAQLAWRDDSLGDPIALELRASADVDPLDLGGAGSPMVGRIALSLDGVCSDARIDFEARASALRLLANLSASAANLTAGPLAVYLPAGVEFAHEHGSAHAQFEFDGSLESDGSLQVRAQLGPTHLLAPDGERTLDVERVTARARLRTEPTHQIELSELSSRGVRAIAELDAAGALTFAGLRFAPRAMEEPDDEVAVSGGGSAANSVHRSTPRVSVGGFALELTELKFVRPGAEPARLSLRVAPEVEPARDSAFAVWLAPFDEVAHPMRLAITGALQPACGEFELHVEAAPCAPTPRLSIRARASELSSAGVLALAPELAAHVTPGELEHGEASAAFDAHFDVRRRQPLELDPGAKIGFEAVLAQLALRAAPEGPLLAGLDALRIEGGEFLPRDSSVKIAAIELERPSLRVTRDPSGIRALGFVARPRASIAAATPDPHVNESAGSVGPSAAIDEPLDLRIERIVASGLDVLLEDSSGPERALFPLNALDAEIKRFALRGLARGEPLAFRATLGAAEVELPPRITADSLLEGVAAGVLAAFDDDRGARKRESRPLFAELNVSGKLALAPAPSGWVALNVEALELPALRGPALSSGMEIGDGLVDLDVRVRLAGAAGLSVDARTSFAHLALSEPADGPLARYLSLPAPLDTVLFLLKDAEGRHKFSAGFRAPPEGLSAAALARSAAGAAAEVIARAVASSPLRLLSTLTDAAGLTGGEEPPPRDLRVLSFESGDPTPARDARRSLAGLVERIRGRPRQGLVLEHELSRADLERALKLVHPSSGDRARLVARLREQRAELSRERDFKAAQLRAEFALADAARRDAIATQMREFEARVGQCDEALERVLELTRPGAERRAAARARSAAVSLGAERIERVRRELLALGVEPERILARVVKSQVGAVSAGGGSVRVWVR